MKTIGNLDIETQEEELHQLFTTYGPVNRVNIVTDHKGQPRGFAFVEMASTADGDKAIAALHCTQHHGRTLNVNEALPRPQRVAADQRGWDRGRGGGRHRW